MVKLCLKRKQIWERERNKREHRTAKRTDIVFEPK